MSTVTLIGTRLADVGQEFVYQGPAEPCAGCPYTEQCLNLESGVKYRIMEVRDGGQVLDCGVHDTGVRAVEVDPVPMHAAVPTKNAYAGSRTQLAGDCPHSGCPSYQYCNPDGAEIDQEYRIQDVLGDPPHEHCRLGRDLTLVEFAPGTEE